MLSFKSLWKGEHIEIITPDKYEAVHEKDVVTEKLSETIFVRLSDMPDIIAKDNIDFLLMGGYEILMNVLPNHIRI